MSDPTGKDPQVLLLRQYRYAVAQTLWEIPAGRLEPGEAPLECAHRELLEETGCRAKRMEPLTAMWTTPGFTNEKIHLFLASELTRGAVNHEADEFMPSTSAWCLTSRWRKPPDSKADFAAVMAVTAISSTMTCGARATQADTGNRLACSSAIVAPSE